jgi:hypothetical protein
LKIHIKTSKLINIFWFNKLIKVHNFLPTWDGHTVIWGCEWYHPNTLIGFCNSFANIYSNKYVKKLIVVSAPILEFSYNASLTSANTCNYTTFNNLSVCSIYWLNLSNCNILLADKLNHNILLLDKLNHNTVYCYLTN